MPVTDRSDFGRGQAPRLVALEAFVVCLQLRLFDQSLFPLTLERASDQPIRRSVASDSDATVGWSPARAGVATEHPASYARVPIGQLPQTHL